MEEDFPYKNPL